MGTQRLFAVTLSVAAFLTCAGRQAMAGGVLQVDADAPAGGDGGSWTTAFIHLQDALALAAACDVAEIRVAQGLYRPDRSAGEPAGSGDRDASFHMLSGVALRGGYAGLGAPDPDARDIAAWPSVLSGDLLGDDVAGFVNSTDNAYSVVTASGVDASAALDGFVITAGNAAGWEGGPLHWRRGAGMWNDGGSPVISGCRFENNRSLRGGGGIYSSGGSPAFTACAFVANVASAGGAIASTGVTGGTILGCSFSANRNGAIAAWSSQLTLLGCTFVQNTTAAGAGGGIASEGSELAIRHCSFDGNAAAIGGGIWATESAVQISSCSFRNNVGQFSTGGMLLTDGMTGAVSNCTFVRNTSGTFGGALMCLSDLTFVNCVFSRNEAFGINSDSGGAIYIDQAVTFTNCTMSHNEGSALLVNHQGPTLANCIVWGNTPQQIVEFYSPAPLPPELYYTNIQGGWSGPGSGNLDVDPLFVQPGTDDVRLAFGSPCIDGGSTALLPPDATDLDGDGNLVEPTSLDLDGQPRVAGASVDLGAYEGGHSPQMAAASDSASGIEPGETVILDPGNDFDPYQGVFVAFTNTSGTVGASVTITEWFGNLHPGAGGYTHPAGTLTLETSLAPGEFSAQFLVSFDPAALDGVDDPLRVRATRFDALAGSWAIAVAANTADSPGFNGPIGDSLNLILGEGGAGPNGQLGDYGVSWNPQTLRGYVWANVDQPGDYGYGVARCPADCRQTPDGVVSIDDVVTLLTSWGDQPGHGPCDIDFDGTVDEDDLLALITAWGPCGMAAAGAPPAFDHRRSQLEQAGICSVEDVLELVRTFSMPAP